MPVGAGGSSHSVLRAQRDSPSRGTTERRPQTALPGRLDGESPGREPTSQRKSLVTANLMLNKTLNQLVIVLKIID